MRGPALRRGEAGAYEVASVRVHSAFRIPVPVALPGGAPGFRIAAGAGPCPEPASWVPSWLDDAGEPIACGAWGVDGLLLKRRGGDVFRFSHDGGTVAFWPASPDPLLAAHAVLDVAVPLQLGRRGLLVLHGAVIESRGRAVAVLGDSGAGKSTVAAAWAARGGRFLADDWFVVDEDGAGFRVRPTHPSLRVSPGMPAPSEGDLFADLAVPEARGRRWLVVSRESGLFGETPLPLERVVVWRRQRDGGGVSCRRLSASESMDALLRAFFALELESASLWEHALPRLGALSGSCEGVEITVADGLDGLEKGLALLAA